MDGASGVGGITARSMERFYLEDKWKVLVMNSIKLARITAFIIITACPNKFSKSHK